MPQNKIISKSFLCISIILLVFLSCISFSYIYGSIDYQYGGGTFPLVKVTFNENARISEYYNYIFYSATNDIYYIGQKKEFIIFCVLENFEKEANRYPYLYKSIFVHTSKIKILDFRYYSNPEVDYNMNLFDYYKANPQNK